ncbi:MAG: hypothetical protein U1E60_08930 [Reyranellaceae bacterium]
MIGEIADKVGELVVSSAGPTGHLQQQPDLGRRDGRHPRPLRRDLRDLRPHAGRLRARARPARLQGISRGAAPCGIGCTTSPASPSGSKNFREIFTNEEANARNSRYREHPAARRDPVTAEKLIRATGFGVQRVPMETNLLRSL